MDSEGDMVTLLLRVAPSPYLRDLSLRNESVYIEKLGKMSDGNERNTS